MFMINNENDAKVLKRFATILKDKENIILNSLEKIIPEDDKYKDLLNCFNTTFSIRTACDDAISSQQNNTNSVEN